MSILRVQEVTPARGIVPPGGLKSGVEEEKQVFLFVPIWLPSGGHGPLRATRHYYVWIYTINIHFNLLTCISSSIFLCICMLSSEIILLLSENPLLDSCLKNHLQNLLLSSYW